VDGTVAPVRAAAVQLTSTDDLDRNLATADRLTRAAARDGARLVVLPEKWPALGAGDVVASGAQDEDGPALRWARETARELGIDLIAGSMAMRHGDRLRNTAVHAGPDGEVHATYTKVHLFDVEVDGQAYRESEHEDAGDEVVVTRTAEGVGVGLAVCYDLRFPGLFEALGARGATILAVPSAFTLPTTRDHWDVLVRARAIEQQAFVLAANQIGEHPGGLRSGGRSMIADPWGVVLATAADVETHIVADLDLDRLHEIREQLPALRHRRAMGAAV
jgi:deaminated glutathione amidase